MPDPKTEELHLEQIDRAAAERDRAEESTEDAERHAHERRAERAAYLRDKLGERAASEDEKRDDA